MQETRCAKSSKTGRREGRGESRRQLHECRGPEREAVEDGRREASGARELLRTNAEDPRRAVEDGRREEKDGAWEFLHECSGPEREAVVNVGCTNAADPCAKPSRRRAPGNFRCRRTFCTNAEDPRAKAVEDGRREEEISINSCTYAEDRARSRRRETGAGKRRRERVRRCPAAFFCTNAGDPNAKPSNEGAGNRRMDAVPGTWCRARMQGTRARSRPPSRELTPRKRRRMNAVPLHECRRPAREAALVKERRAPGRGRQTPRAASRSCACSWSIDAWRRDLRCSVRAPTRRRLSCTAICGAELASRLRHCWQPAQKRSPWISQRRWSAVARERCGWHPPSRGAELLLVRRLGARVSAARADRAWRVRRGCRTRRTHAKAADRESGTSDADDREDARQLHEADVEARRHALGRSAVVRPVGAVGQHQRLARHLHRPDTVAQVENAILCSCAAAGCGAQRAAPLSHRDNMMRARAYAKNSAALGPFAVPSVSPKRRSHVRRQRKKRASPNTSARYALSAFAHAGHSSTASTRCKRTSALLPPRNAAHHASIRAA